MLSFPLFEIHEVATKNHHRDSDDKQHQANIVQQWMKLRVQQPTRR